MTREEIILEGRKVLDMEANAIKDMSASLGDSFVDAVELMHKTKGRVIVTGMGKSGHVGRKIAATLASVGTPAFFVHPAEASHGDLGMFTTDDVILALSNSGESKELADVIAFSRRFGIGLICMVGNANSTLAKASDIVICYPPFKEACSFGMAPTTSTTLSLAMGDALAMALLEAKGFSREQYNMRHPGGKLGAMLLKAKELMVTGDGMPVVAPHTQMTDALIEMTKKTLGCVVVADPDGSIRGIITDGDLRRHMGVDLLRKSVEDIMTPTPKMIAGDLLAAEAVRLMNDKKITILLVAENNKLQGVLQLYKCLQAGVV